MPYSDRGKGFCCWLSAAALPMRCMRLKRPETAQPQSQLRFHLLVGRNCCHARPPQEESYPRIDSVREQQMSGWDQDDVWRDISEGTPPWQHYDSDRWRKPKRKEHRANRNSAIIDSRCQPPLDIPYHVS